VANRIEPRTLKGFRDYKPDLMIPRERVLQTAREVYRSYGYAPIDTPALEYAEVLLGKGGGENDRLVYRFKDHGNPPRDVAMRFDLTVPFARFAAQHISELGTPFKRYAMGPVWRGENTAAGRYREFWQCDFDFIGTTSNAADVEVALVIYDLMRALELDKFQLRVNNRAVLNGVLETLGLVDRSVPILRALDKFDKIGRDGVKAELTDTDPQRAALSSPEADGVLAVTTAFAQMSNEDILLRLSTHCQHPTAAAGLYRLRELWGTVRQITGTDDWLRIDPAIARGLDYYTGTIYETFLLDKPDIGSICSGGRYDNLASLYTKQVLPGVGASLGVDRLLAAMEELKHPWLTGSSTPAPVLVLQFDAARLGDYQRIARSLRAGGVAAEVYPEAKKLGQQFQYAERKGFKLAVIAGPEEFAAGNVKLKDLARREEQVIPEADLVKACRLLLGMPRG
jgi:histidyl-tRNA synthetase